MKKFFSLIIYVLIMHLAQAQIGHISKSFYDQSRNRNITAEIYYPSEDNGDNVPISAGSFPQIIFGHGFLMPWSDYENIWTSLVPEGYIFCFVTTEGGFAPSHEAFGLDLAFCSEALLMENENTQSLLFNSMTASQAIMGHSMGGGATWLGASDNSTIETIVGLAPAETNPSAISAAQDVNVPTLVISGSADAITPPEDHHTPIFESTASACKAFVSLLEGGHCGFANQGICDFGELFFQGMSRELQQEITQTLLLSWFNYFLKGEDSAWTSFETYCASNADVECTVECATTIDDASENMIYSVFPNPTSGAFRLQNVPPHSVITIHDSMGRLVLKQNANAMSEILLPENSANGIYSISIFDGHSHILMNLLVE